MKFVFININNRYISQNEARVTYSCRNIKILNEMDWLDLGGCVHLSGCNIFCS